jgi:hypothetical protein
MMERGDKYYMAICNKTGMLAIYNPNKNMFLSPMADGPLRYMGPLDGKDINIENVSRYGRDFSVVCIPYSLKLLIQELQTINIQMRLITEDNIEQLENLSYSKNIEILVNKTGITAKDVIQGIQREIAAESEKRGVFEKPVSPIASTPLPTVVPMDAETQKRMEKELEEKYGFFETGQSPKPSPSPTYPEGVSPAYQPSTTTNYSNMSSPGYNPLSNDTVSLVEEQKIYSHHSPVSPPPQTGGSILDILSEQAQTFHIGEPVLYRGGGDPSRLWTITHIGDKFIKIEPQTIDGNLAYPDDVKIVTAMDIYRPVMQDDSRIPFDMYSPHNQIQNPYAPANPSINFAPVIKIVNDGNDYSTEPLVSTSESTPNPTMLHNLMPAMNTEERKKDKDKDNSDSAGDVGKIDFSKLVIKKV